VEGNYRSDAFHDKSNPPYAIARNHSFNSDNDDGECPSAPPPPDYTQSCGEVTFLSTSTGGPVVEAEPLEEGHTIRAFFRKKTVRCFMALLFVLFVLLALGAIYALTGFAFNKNDAENFSGSNDPIASATPSSAPTSQGDLQLEYFVRLALPDYTRVALTRVDSPQTKALLWLQNNTNLESYTLSRRLQRFALATLYFSTGGEKRWIKDYGWLSDEDECTWFSSEIDVPICTNNELKVLSLKANGLRGTIANEISLLSSLELLRLNENIITGFLPSTLGVLTGLKEISFCKFFVSCLT
jgi:hypothetical protein